MEFPQIPGLLGPIGQSGMDPQKQGLLAAAFAGLQASGNSRMPVSFGQTMGQAGQAGMGAMRQAEHDQQRAQASQMQQQMQMQKYAEEMAQRQQQQAVLQSLRPQLKDPAAVALFDAGDYKGAVARQFPQEEYTVQTVQGANGPELKYVPKRPGMGQVQGVGVSPYQAALDPAVRNAKIDDAVKQETALQPLKIAQRVAGKPDIRNQVDIKQETEEAKKVGGFFGDNYADIQKAGMSANGKIARVNRLNQLLQGVDTGKLTPAGTELAAYAQSLGMKIDPSLGNKQAATALANEMALELRNPAGGAGMPGALSDKDREFLVSMVPGLSTSPEGRKQITNTMRKLAQRDQEVARMAREYRQKNGSLNEGFYQKLQDYSNANPLFGVTESVSDVRAKADAILKGK